MAFYYETLEPEQRRAIMGRFIYQGQPAVAQYGSRRFAFVKLPAGTARVPWPEVALARGWDVPDWAHRP